jgi:hypothetical protein
MYYVWKCLAVILGVVIAIWALPLALMMKVYFWLRKRMDPNFDPMAEALKQAIQEQKAQEPPGCCHSHGNVPTPEQMEQAAKFAAAMGAFIAEKMKTEHPELVADTKKLVDEKLEQAKPSLPVVATEKR